MRSAIGSMFDPFDSISDANRTISNAFDTVQQQWRDFSLEFISVNADAEDNKVNSKYDFQQNYLDARRALFAYSENDDSVRGLITFSMNRVSWAGQQAERVNEIHLLKYGNYSCRYFYNVFQREAVKSGAEKKGFLSDDVDDDFYILAQNYKDSRDAVLLYGAEASAGNAMHFAKIVWKAAREQFRYMLAMNDILFKAEKQILKQENGENILSDFHTKEITYKYAAASFPVTAESFWKLFTGPSLQVMLHYSVNSYTDDPVEIKSPLAVAAIAAKEAAAKSGSNAEVDSSNENEAPEGSEQTPVGQV